MANEILPTSTTCLQPLAKQPMLETLQVSSIVTLIYDSYISNARFLDTLESYDFLSLSLSPSPNLSTTMPLDSDPPLVPVTLLLAHAIGG